MHSDIVASPVLGHFGGITVIMTVSMIHFVISVILAEKQTCMHLFVYLLIINNCLVTLEKRPACFISHNSRLKLQDKK